MSEEHTEVPSWESLTVVPQKRQAYERDLYFRECWADLCEIFGPGVPPSLRSLAMMNVKPDAVAGRRLTPVLELVLARGYRVVAVRTVPLTRHSMREVWRYDWDVYTTDRLAFSTLWYTAADVLLLILEHDDTEPLPATVRLSESKGNALPEKRGPEHMRTLLRPPNRILNFVHVAEEPADIVREIGIFFDREERRALLGEIRAHRGTHRPERARAAIAELESRYPAHDLDLEASLVRVASASPALRAGVQRLREQLHTGRPLSWNGLVSMIDPLLPETGRWDFLTIASHVIEYERRIDAPAIPAPDAAQWARRADLRWLTAPEARIDATDDLRVPGLVVDDD